MELITGNSIYCLQTEKKIKVKYIYKHLDWDRQNAILVTLSIPFEFRKYIQQAEIMIDQTNLTKNFSNGDADYENLVPGTVSFNQPFIFKSDVFRLDGFVDEKGFED
ncbi:unnamed protein product [Cunninghamella echinulata]